MFSTKLKFTILVSTLLITSISNVHVLSDTIQTTESGRIDDGYVPVLDRQIKILYDANNEITERQALGAYSFLSAFYQPLKLQSLSTLDDIQSDNEDWIFIHFYNTTAIGPIIGGEQNHWTDLSRTIIQYQDSEHVLAIANTKQASQMMGPALTIAHIADNQTEASDASLSVIYALWVVGEILQEDSSDTLYSEIGEKITDMVLRYFSSHLDEILTLSLQPRDVIGVPAVEPDQAIENYINDMDQIARYVDENNQSIPINEMSSSDFEPHGFSLSPDDSGFVFGSIPDITGIEGPAGELLDRVLETISPDYRTLSLGSSTVTALTDLLSFLPKSLGIISDPSVPNLFEEMLNDVIVQFPQYSLNADLINLIGQSFTTFRSGANNIIDFFLETLVELDSSQMINFTEFEIYLNEHKTDLIQSTDNSEEIFQEISNWLLKINLNSILTPSIFSTFGFNETNMPQNLPSLQNIISSLIQSFNFEAPSDYMSDIWPFLLDQIQNFVSEIDDSIPQIDQVLDPIRGLTGLISWVAAKQGSISNSENYLETNTLVNTLTEYFNSLINGLGISLSNIHTAANHFAGITDDILSGTYSTSNQVNTQLDHIISLLGISNVEVQSFVYESLQLMAARLAYPDTSIKQITDSKFGETIDHWFEIIRDQFEPNTFNFISNIVHLVTDGTLLINGQLKSNANLIRLETNSNANPHDLFENTQGDIYIKNIVVSLFEIIDISFLNTTQTINFNNLIDEIEDHITTVISVMGSSANSWSQSVGNLPLLLQTAFLNQTELGVENVLTGLDSIQLLFSELIVNRLNSEVSILETTTESTIGTSFIGLNSVFTDGVIWLDTQIRQWIQNSISEFTTPIIENIRTLINNLPSIQLFHYIPFGFDSIFGRAIFLEIYYTLFLSLTVELNPENLNSFLTNLLLNGGSLFNSGNPSVTILEGMMSFINFEAVFEGSFRLRQVTTGFGGLLQKVLLYIGIDISAFVDTHFRMNLRFLGANGFDSQSIFFLGSWRFFMSFLLSVRIGLFDIISNGIIHFIGGYIGLGSVGFSFVVGMQLSIVARAESATASASAIVLLNFFVRATLDFSISVLIATLTISGGVQANIIAVMDPLSPIPLFIKASFFVILGLRLEVSVVLWSQSWQWWFPLFPIAPTVYYATDFNQILSFVLGYDRDFDGLPDDFERGYPGLNDGYSIPGLGASTSINSLISEMDIIPQTFSRSSSDTDGDGLTDKQEIRYTNTDPSVIDSDGDGLTDYEEVMIYVSNPNSMDSDSDGLSDYLETKVYFTDELNADSDGDGLTDEFEIRQSYNMDGVTPSVEEVIIGGISYNNKTDPLNPDTDNDLLLDGQEGKFGAHFGSQPSVDVNEGTLDLVWNEGYTHPLDNDTDDDSYMQAWDGTVLPSNIYLGDMRDGIEVRGITTTFVENNDYLTRTFYTDPTRSDSDSDTGPGGEGVIMVSDGYELYDALYKELPTDPLSGDQDNDGLPAALELLYGTDDLDPDSDNDGLSDKLEVLLFSNPLMPDQDGDGLTDGQEYFETKSNMYQSDTDFDGLNDLEELQAGTDLRKGDTDSDGFNDRKEVIELGTSPIVSDSDGDGLSDRDELNIYGTDLFSVDTDGDLLSDYDEVVIHRTSPHLLDSDRDSILEQDASGNVIAELSDYEEVMTTGTSPFTPDSDGDGIVDGLELYLASGKSSLGVIALDPLSNDTDSDQLTDIDEINIDLVSLDGVAEVEVTYPFSSSPVNNDTDSDNVDDWTEVYNGTRPDYYDSDGDTLPDYEEYYVYQDVSPLNADSDNDFLPDSVELLNRTDNNELEHYPETDFDIIESSGMMTVNVDPSIIPDGLNVASPEIKYYNTYAFSNDTDKDLIPDGVELVLYKPNFPDFDPGIGQNDTNGNNITDGLDVDLDNDLLEDGLEYFGNHTDPLEVSWPTLNPDQDLDRIPDGVEYYETGTSVRVKDTDQDGFSDGFEYFVGSDPLLFTSQSDMGDILGLYDIPIFVLSPIPGAGYVNSSGIIPVVVFNITSVDATWYRYRNLSDPFGANTSLLLDTSGDPKIWYDLNSEFATGIYELEAFAQIGGTIYNETILFAVNNTLLFEVDTSDPDDGLTYVYVAGVLVVVSIVGVAVSKMKKEGI